MVSETVEKCVGQLLGLGLSEENEKNKILTFLGIGMGGILLALQAVIANKRAQAMEDAANAQAEANQNTERGQRQERLKNAIEHLGHASDSVRLGSAYELFHLAQDNKDLCQTVMDILCAHIRRTTGEAEYREKHPSKPSEEVQSLLTLLFVQEHKVFKSCHINLQGSWLNGASLQEARLEKAVLQKAQLYEANLGETYLHEANLAVAHLRRANLAMAHLHRANLAMAYLHEAILLGAHLREANLIGADLHEANLLGAYLHGANLSSAQLHGVLLANARLYGTVLMDAHLYGADLDGAQLCGANLHEAHLQGTNLRSAKLQGVSVRSDVEYIQQSFADRMRDAINKENDLSGVTFTGGLSREDVDSIVGGLSDEKARALRTKLEPRIGKPESYELPKDSGAITGAYTEEEAEQWIAEYEKAMSEIPGDNS